MKRRIGKGAGGMLTLITIIATVGAGGASAATTAVSTVTKSGSDASTGSIASSSGVVGATSAGHTIDWVVHYRNTSGQTAAADLRDVIGPNQTFVSGSLKVPSGFTGRWSTDGGTTFASAEPASGVTAIGAVGSSVDGSTGDQIIVAPAGSSGFNVGAVGGDGWEALFLGANVYNVHHHRQAGSGLTMIDCHVKATGAACPHFAGGGTYVSENAGDPVGTGPDTLTTAFTTNGVADPATDRIYFPVSRNASTSFGVACIDVHNTQAPVSCGYTQLGNGPFTASSNFAQVTGGGLIGSKYYLLDGTGRIHCLDISTQTACAGLAAPAGLGANANTVQLSGLEVFDNRYVFATLTAGTGDMLCLDTTTGASCPGFPILGTGTRMPIAPTLSTTGAVNGICGAKLVSGGTSWVCHDLTGSPKPTPWTQQVQGANVNWGGLGSIATVGTKLYFAETIGNVATYTCWDFAIGAPCVGFVSASSGADVRAYTVRQDPTAPDCIWVIGDAGRFETFSATFGGLSCEAPTRSAVTIDPASSYCDGGRGHATGWRALTIGGVTAADYDGVAVTITGIDGNVVPGWNARVFPDTQQSIDISSIALTGNTARLRISVTFSRLKAAATVTATFEGDPVQVCFKTRVGGARCSSAAPVTNVATVVTSAGRRSDAPSGNGSGTATFRVANDPKQCDDPPRRALLIRKRADKRLVRAGGLVRYAIRVTNPNAVAVQNVRVCDLLPQGLAYVGSTPTATLSNGLRCWSIGTLAPHASRTVRLKARALLGTCGRKRNTARVTGRGVRPRTAHWTIRVRSCRHYGGGVTG